MLKKRKNSLLKNKKNKIRILNPYFSIYFAEINGQVIWKLAREV